jgi:hypothetical protein
MIYSMTLLFVLVHTQATRYMYVFFAPTELLLSVYTHTPRLRMRSHVAFLPMSWPCLTELGQRVEASYRTFARSVMQYEKRCFAGWAESINSVAMAHLKARHASLLAKACVALCYTWIPAHR